MKLTEQRTFDKETYSFVKKLLWQLHSCQIELDERTYRRLVESDTSRLFILYDDAGVPAGMCTVCLCHVAAGIKAWLEDVVVDEGQRGKGYSKFLIQAAVKFAGEAGADGLMLTSNPLRVAANNLYISCGFERYDTNVYKLTFDRD